MRALPSAGIRAIDHVGLTVPSLAEAARFFTEAFGARVIFEMDTHRDTSKPEVLAEEQAKLGTRPTARWSSTLVLRLGDGPSIELFEYEDPDRLPPPTPSDLGIQHFGIYVDDIDAACEAVIAAGGSVLDGPTLLPALESGAGNKWVYVTAPWGGIIELCSYPSPQLYEERTEVRRWRPPAGEDGEPSRSPTAATAASDSQVSPINASSGDVNRVPRA
jgi:catechol 2,3-dioxygenase-like lactoylglutathione lyase family enzyme